MSFAPQKKGSRKTSPDSMRKSNNNFADPREPNSAQSRYSHTGDSDIVSRIEALEANLSKISTQQDSFLPLMNMLELAPVMTKNENLLKNLNRKGQETEDRIGRLEQMLKSYQQNIELTVSRINVSPKVIQADTSMLEKTIKDVAGQANKQGVLIKDLESTVANTQKAIETKVSELTTNTSRACDLRLERQKAEFSSSLNDLNKNIDLTFKKFEEAVRDLYGQAEKFDEFTQNNNRQKILDDVNELITTKFQEQFDFFNEKYDRDIDNLYREFGILRSEMDLINEEKRQAKMAPHLQTLPKDPTPSEKKIKYNNVEQALNIHELDKFNKETTQRIMYELQSFDEKLDQIRERYTIAMAKIRQDDVKEIDPILNEALEKYNNEMEYMNDRYMSPQISDRGSKYFFDMRHIDEKMEKIQQIKREAQEEMTANPKLKRTIPQELQVIEGFPDKIKGLMEAIGKNLESTFTRLEIIEEKLKENQDVIKRKKR